VGSNPAERANTIDANKPPKARYAQICDDMPAPDQRRGTRELKKRGWVAFLESCETAGVLRSTAVLMGLAAVAFTRGLPGFVSVALIENPSVDPAILKCPDWRPPLRCLEHRVTGTLRARNSAGC